MDLGNKTIKNFKTQTQPEMITPQEDTTLQALEATQEGLHNDKEKTQHPTIIPTDLLPKHKKPQHYKLDIIRAIAYPRNTQGQLVEDITYKGKRCLQLIKCKYSTDSNTLDTTTKHTQHIGTTKTCYIATQQDKKTPGPDHPRCSKQNGQFPNTKISRDSSTSILQGKPTRKHNI